MAQIPIISITNCWEILFSYYLLAPKDKKRLLSMIIAIFFTKKYYEKNESGKGRVVCCFEKKIITYLISLII